jgi:DNA-binding sugar fermentation-stimulating protein
VQYGDVQQGLLLKRYKRFLADVKLVAVNGTSPEILASSPTLKAEHPDDFITVHCPNTGPMTGLLDRYCRSRPLEFVRASA